MMRHPRHTAKRIASEPSVRRIVAVTAAELGFDTTRLRGMSQERTLTMARQMAMHIARDLTSRSTITIGEVIGRDHTTVISGVRRMEALLADREDLRQLRARIVARVLSPGVPMPTAAPRPMVSPPKAKAPAAAREVAARPRPAGATGLPDPDAFACYGARGQLPRAVLEAQDLAFGRAMGMERYRDMTPAPAWRGPARGAAKAATHSIGGRP